jgi:hypothetical protein
VTLSDNKKIFVAVINLLIHLGFPAFSQRTPNFLLHRHPFLHTLCEIISP